MDDHGKVFHGKMLIMGLTISYTLASEADRPEDARALIEELHDRARELPFAHVDQIIEVQGSPAYDADNLDNQDPFKWLKIQACHLLHYEFRNEEHWVHVAPEHLIAFTVNPGDGCEHANFGLCLYPKTIAHNGRRVRTKLASW